MAPKSNATVCHSDRSIAIGEADHNAERSNLLRFAPYRISGTGR
jgi:hypothetical protein